MPQSPCISLCRIDDRTGLCAGCGRSLAEIAAWAALPEAERRRIMAELPSRFGRHHAGRCRTRGGGEAGRGR